VPLTLERIQASGPDWERMDAFPDRVVFQTREWVDFIARTQRAVRPMPIRSAPPSWAVLAWSWKFNRQR